MIKSRSNTSGTEIPEGKNRRVREVRKKIERRWSDACEHLAGL